MAACRGQALQLWLLAVVTIGAVAQVVLVPDDAAVHTLDERDGPALAGAHSLPDLGEGAGEGVGAMTEAMVSKAQKDMVRLATSFKSEPLQMEGFGLQRLANKVFLEEGTGSRASGLDLIFRKLDELEKKIKGEEEAEAEVENNNLEQCKNEIKRANDAISTSSGTRKANQQEIAQASATIEKNRQEWKESREVEMQTHESLVSMQQERKDATEAVTARVNERNKAIDVMVQATFMVCQRFNRYKNTAQCIEIKSQPDVDEPQRYATKDAAKAEKESETFHQKGSPWEEKWKAQMEKDIKLEGKSDPEGLLAGAEEEAPAPAPAPVAAPAAAPAKESALSLIQLESSGESKALSKQQMQTVAQLEKLSRTKGLKPKYAIPLTELAMSLKTGAAKRSKSIVQILQEVLKETRQEQANDKANHDVYLGECYKQSWDWKATINEHTQKQAELRAEMESLRLRIIELNGENEENRKIQNDNSAARTKEENRCWAQSESYGVRASLRAEDLENLVKLKSILRSLYFKQFPKACPRHTNKVVCANTDQGMCVFTDKKKNNMEQRCSCNPGFYGKACELVMCPGIAKNLYKHDAPGVCSNRGVCDNQSGLCKCHAAFFHGPKRACDYKYSPPSKGDDCSPNCDNQCSNRGKFDPIRGECTCNTEFFGPGCEQRKCPNSNGVLYPMSSGNSCNGRGPCDPDTGRCGCPVVKEGCATAQGSQCGPNECHDRNKCGNPYFGSSCEFERCPNDCMGRGNCNHQTGKCTCGNDDRGQPFYGPSCEFRSCPNDCNGAGAGECNRNNGKCICKDGYSGETCIKTSRCEAPALNNAEMNWWTIWDKPGWMVCPKGQLMYSLKRTLCQALSCIGSGGCAAACEGSKHVFQLRHCYHDLRWYSSFDSKGVSTCLNDYFVAGLFRSCESLYCLNMAKCCSLKEARWTQCSWSNWAIFNGPGTGRVEDHKFIVGFKRDEGHQLKDIDEAKGCGFVRGY